MLRRPLLLAATVLTVAFGSGALATASSDAPRVATGFIASEVCSAAFVSGLDPERIFAETLSALPGAALISWGIKVDVDHTAMRVTTTFLGAAASRAAYRDGLGCMPENGVGPIDATLPAGETLPPAALPAIAGPEVVEPSDPRLRHALDEAFSEPGGDRVRHTKAVLVLKDGRIVAERYAPGIGIDTPLHGFSMTKSVISALVGVLVRQGRLSTDQPAPLEAWRDTADPRHAITIDHLLRHTSGLALGSSLSASLASVFDPVNCMKYAVRDRAGFAAEAPLEAPAGTRWNYQDGNTVLLSRIIRDQAGGRAADVLRMARRELFAPLGMDDVTLEMDATGTPEGSSQMFAPARAWARFGLLYLDDGVVGGVRILPRGWVDYSARPTPGAFVGYGAGFWTNRGDSEGARRRIAFGMPADAIHARGQFGQYVVIVPSERLVVVRLGLASSGGDPEGVSRLVAEVIAATHGAGS